VLIEFFLYPLVDARAGSRFVSHVSGLKALLEGRFSLPFL